MSAFEQACEVEQLAVGHLLDFIGARSLNGRFVLTDKGRLSRELQARYGDVIVNRAGDGVLLSIEIKSETKTTGNLFLETWSNRARRKLGWMYTLDADLLLYYFLDEEVLYTIPFPALTKWAFGCGTDGPGKLYVAGREVRQRRYEQLNDTWGRIVPIQVISEGVGHVRSYQRVEGEFRQL